MVFDYLCLDLHLVSLPNVETGRFKIIIDPGHGGPDTGAIGLKGVKETDIVSLGFGYMF